MVRCCLDLELGPFELYFKAVALPFFRKEGLELQLTLGGTHTSKTVHNAHPGSGHAGSMQALPSIAVVVIEIEPHRLQEVIVGKLGIAYFRSDNAVDGWGEGRVMCCPGLLVVEIGLLLFQRELIT